MDLLEHLKTHWPQDLKMMGPSSDQFLKTAVTRAGKRGINAHRYLDVMIVLGAEFEADPQLPWAHAGGQRPTFATEDLRHLWQWTFQYVKRDSGEDGALYRGALARAAKAAKDFAVGDPRFIKPAQAADLLNHIHPEKFKLMKDELDPMFELALKHAKKHGITAGVHPFYLVLMFLFGSHFESDPRYTALAGFKEPISNWGGKLHESALATIGRCAGLNGMRAASRGTCAAARPPAFSYWADKKGMPDHGTLFVEQDALQKHFLQVGEKIANAQTKDFYKKLVLRAGKTRWQGADSNDKARFNPWGPIKLKHDEEGENVMLMNCSDLILYGAFLADVMTLKNCMDLASFEKASAPTALPKLIGTSTKLKSAASVAPGSLLLFLDSTGAVKHGAMYAGQKDGHHYMFHNLALYGFDGSVGCFHFLTVDDYEKLFPKETCYVSQPFWEPDAPTHGNFDKLQKGERF